MGKKWAHAARQLSYKTVGEECEPERSSYIDESCPVPPPIPGAYLDSTIEMLCDRLDEITRYLRKICNIVRS
jgi:hypothetical protein